MEHLRLTRFRKLIVSPEGFLLVATVIGYAFAYSYLLIMGRLLGPDDFGILGALFAIFYIAALVGQALREVVATQFAEVRARESERAAIGVFRRIAVRLCAISFLPCLAIIIAAKPVAAFFNIDSPWSVIIVAFAVFTALVLDVVLGLLQGLQMFRALGITGYTTSQGLKVVLGLAFIWFGWGLLGAVGALVVSTTVGVMVGLILVNKQLVNAIHTPVNTHLRLGPILLRTLILAIFISMPASVDVMLVTHFFGGKDAGLYNAVATIGKVVFFLPMAITMVLLPRATERHTHGKESRTILLQSLGITVLLSGVVAIISWAFPDIITRLCFGEKYMEAVSLIGLYATAMFFFSIDVVLIHYSLAIRNFWLIVLADLVTLAQAVAIVLWHQSLSQIIWILFYGNLMIILFSFPYLAFKKPGHCTERGNIR